MRSFWRVCVPGADRYLCEKKTTGSYILKDYFWQLLRFRFGFSPELPLKV